jgi:hypothetical protein
MKTYILEEACTEEGKKAGLYFLWDAEHKECLKVVWLPEFQTQGSNAVTESSE